MDLHTQTSLVVVICGRDLQPDLSIIVPVYNRLEQLRDLLQALGNQAGLRVPFEVVLSDDGSEEDIQTLAKAFASRFPRLVYVRGPNSGPGIARNRGVDAASASVIAFTDSDCTPTPSWAATIYQTVTIRGGIAYGPIRPPFPAVPPFIQAFDMDDRFQRPTGAANLAMETALFRSLGGFSATVSRIAEDHDLANRAAAAGVCFHYATAALVVHPVRPGRLHLGLFVSRGDRPLHEQLAKFSRASEVHQSQMVRSNRELLRRAAAKLLLLVAPAALLPSWAKAAGFLVLAALALSKWLRANASLTRAGHSWRIPFSDGLRYSLLIPFTEAASLLTRMRFGYLHLRTPSTTRSHNRHG